MTTFTQLYLSAAQFEDEVAVLLKRLLLVEEVGDFGWRLQRHSHELGDVELCVSRPFQQTTVLFDQSTDEELDMEAELVEDTCCVAVASASAGRPSLVEYRVAYSEAHQVPILYVRAQGLRLSHLWQHLAQQQQPPRQPHDLWSAISQVEHPRLQLPCFQVHPCRTATLMASLHSARAGYLCAWLSVYGPALGLQLPLAALIAAADVG